MGMFDTILFDQPILCPKCGAEITSDQTKAFECTLDEYRIGDCIAHAEEIRVVRDELFCGQCKKFTEKHYYLVVYRGILAGIEEDLENPERRLRTFGFETLILWYHDLYAKLQQALGDTHRAHYYTQLDRRFPETREKYERAFGERHFAPATVSARL